MKKIVRWLFMLSAILLMIGFFLRPTTARASSTELKASGTDADSAAIKDAGGNNYQITWKWKIQDGVKIADGDTMTFYLPSNLKIGTTTSFDIENSEGTVVGTANFLRNATEGTVTFNSALSDTVVNRQGIISVSAIGTAVNPTNDWQINKSGWWVEGSPNTIMWNVAINSEQKDLGKVTIIDTLGPNQTYTGGDQFSAATGSWDNGKFVADGGSVTVNVVKNADGTLSFVIDNVTKGVNLTYPVTTSGDAKTTYTNSAKLIASSSPGVPGSGQSTPPSVSATVVPATGNGSADGNGLPVTTTTTTPSTPETTSSSTTTTTTTVPSTTTTLPSTSETTSTTTMTEPSTPATTSTTTTTEPSTPETTSTTTTTEPSTPETTSTTTTTEPSTPETTSTSTTTVPSTSETTSTTTTTVPSTSKSTSTTTTVPNTPATTSTTTTTEPSTPETPSTTTTTVPSTSKSTSTTTTTEPSTPETPSTTTTTEPSTSQSTSTTTVPNTTSTPATTTTIPSTTTNTPEITGTTTTSTTTSRKSNFPSKPVTHSPNTSQSGHSDTTTNSGSARPHKGHKNGVGLPQTNEQVSWVITAVGAVILSAASWVVFRRRG